MIAFACAVFTSAFLVFQVQPVLARFILPWFGGSPAVWTTCMLFFQVGLLCGYAYAHLLASRVALAKQPYVHLTLVVVSMLTLPITPEQTGVITAQAPTLDILLLLAGAVGFPFVMLSASAPLLQHWFANVHPGRSPFRLYALSNLGSLVALLGYPIVVEPAITLATQTFAWSAGYVVFAAVSLWCAWPILSKRLDKPAERDNATPSAPATWSERVIWTLLAACGSIVLLATTNQMCQDVAVIPFLWVLPLSLYLVTFIICFERDSWYLRSLWIPILTLSVGALVVLLHQDYIDDEMSLAYQIAIYTSAMFACCMVCHGEMVRRRPEATQLTTFYLYLAFGGALGGVFVSIIAPLIFDGFWELHLGLLATAVLAGFCIVRDRKALATRVRLYSFGTYWILGVATLAYYLDDHATYQLDDSIVNMRGFYGVLHVYEVDVGTKYHARKLFHGRISHGGQWQSQRDRNRPTTYYGTNSGTGVAINYHPARQTPEGQ
ncbi:MAG: hypothetical protein O7E57_18075, partial [Gammaproteobacteria bacterium]|nr:hypothetical protein [Gammaproteobacteria bacterium]